MVNLLRTGAAIPNARTQRADEQQDSSNETLDPYRHRERDIQDLYYIDRLSSKDIAEFLYQHYKEDIFFTYFGNVLFYLRPPKGTDLFSENARYLYGENDNNPHLYSLMNEILRSIGLRKKKDDVRVVRLKREVSELIGSINVSYDDQGTGACKDNYNVFVYGDSMYEQYNLAGLAVAYTAQRAHIIGLEPSGKMSDMVAAVNELMKYFNDYTSFGRNFCTLQLTYKLNFGKANKLSSISLIPNLATDNSCLAVSSNHRDRLSKRKKSKVLKGVVYRPPSIFYALLYSAIHGKNMRWISASKITPAVARKILEMLPPHELEEPKEHVYCLYRALQLLQKIGFNEEEVKSIMLVLLGILLFDVYNMLVSRDAQVRPRNRDVDDNVDDDGNPDAVTHKDEEGILNPKDVLIYATEVLGIDLLRKTPKLLKSQDLLFRLHVMDANNRSMYDNLASALYFRLKHVIYRTINASLVLKHGSTTAASITVHCNAGNFPQSLSVSKRGDVEIAKRASEELFVKHFIESSAASNCSNKDLIKRNQEAVDRMTGENGLLAKVVLDSQKYQAEVDTDDPWREADLTRVEHSNQAVNYDIQDIIGFESKCYSIPNDLARLLKYSEDKFVLSLFFVRTSLQHTVGPCAAALSYMSFFTDCMNYTSVSYYVVCTDPRWCNRLYRKNLKDETEAIIIVRRGDTDESYEEENKSTAAESIQMALSVNIPVLDLCISQRDGSKASLDLQSAIRTFMPLAYEALPSKLHRVLPLSDEVETVRLLFNALDVPDSMWKVCGNTLTMPRTLCIKLVARASGYVNCKISSIRVIQRWWVGHNTLQLKKVLRRTVVRMQSRIRFIMFQNHVSALATARNLSIDFIGLCLVIYHLNVSLLSSSHKTLQLLHSMEKRYHEKEYNLIQGAAATYIQACWRRTLARRKVMQMRHEKMKDFSVMLVQATIRRLLATAAIVHKKPARDVAATLIQAAYRGYRARVEYDTLCGLKMALLSIIRKGSKLIGLSEQVKFVKERKKHNAMTMQMKKLIIMQTNLPPGFVKAQNLFRMHFIRKQYQNLRSAIEKVQALALTKIARVGYLEKVKAARVIQRWWRNVHKQEVPRLSGSAVYYLSVREQATIAMLRNTCSTLGVIIAKFSIYQDIRRIYPRSWAMEPTEILRHLMKVQRLVVDETKAVPPRITGLEFAIGTYHSLMLAIISDGSSFVYSWGAPSVLETRRARHSKDEKHTEQFEERSSAVTPLVFYKNESTERNPGPGMQLLPLPRITITSIACGNDFSLALSSDGKLFTWGNNRHGQCGQGHRLVYVWSPIMLKLYAVTSMSCGEQHSVVKLSVNEYFAFGRLLGDVLYTPQDLKAYCGKVRYQRIESVACGGYVTLLYTAEINYVLHIIGNLGSFRDTYNLRGSIKGVCTNGYTIFALVDLETEREDGTRSVEQRLYAWGNMRCVSKRFKETLPNTSVLVNNFWEKLDNSKPRPKRSMLKVNSQLHKSTVLQNPTEVVFPKRVVSIACDHQQLIITGQNSAVYGASVFEVINDNPGDIRDCDEYSFKINPEATNVCLEPALYQFTYMEKAMGPISVSYNRLSSSILYATQQ